MIGPSRKSFIGTTLNLPVDDRLEGTAAAVAVGVMNGARIVRVHDVKEIKRVVTIVEKLGLQHDTFQARFLTVTLIDLIDIILDLGIL